MNTACDLCGLPLGKEACRTRHEGAERRFCCDSCRQIYLMLHGDEQGEEGTTPKAKENDDE